MKYCILIASSFNFLFTLQAQNNVQELQPTRVSIFKNGTYFVKKTANVQVERKSFSIAAPTNVLMGSFWLATGKGSTVQSIVVKSDTLQIASSCKNLSDYLKANIKKEISLYRNNQEKEMITGVLLDYDRVGNLVKIRLADKKICIAKASDFDKIIFAESGDTRCTTDWVQPVATIHIQENNNSTLASTLSLQKGMQWVPSYLLKIVNEKEATLTMKATIVNREETLLQADVDIVIGNPEMFYGTTLDPICLGYLSNSLLGGMDNNRVTYNVATLTNGFSQTVSNRREEDSYSGEYDLPEYNGKTGDKMEDLYIYKLGKIDLEKDATVLVPVISTNVNYEDVYSVTLNTNSAFSNNKALEVFHQYRILNNTVAPLTTGSVLVVNATEMPIAQAQLNYTPVNSKQDIMLSKAIDVQVKNEETETKREKAVKKLAKVEMADKVFYTGTIKLNNFQNKKIKITVTKYVEGSVSDANANGVVKKVKDNNGLNSTSSIKWEIELNPGEKKEILYTYNLLETE